MKTTTIKIDYLKKTLIEFLKKERILNRFILNLKIPLEELLREEEVQYCKATIIHRAIIWSDTEKGYNFWRKKSGRWAKFLHQNYSIYRRIEKESKNIESIQINS